ncbi:unnamed protein product [Durusdinium trenchii]|uniref:Uncharacterized protein n=1 Tax=Durusdinium trenchii TaxID=1381693 RepID=A0ABP0MVE7_9DINO
MLVQFAWLCSSPHDGCEPEGDKSARQEDQLKSKVQKMLREKHRRQESTCFCSGAGLCLEQSTADGGTVVMVALREGEEARQRQRQRRRQRQRQRQAGRQLGRQAVSQADRWTEHRCAAMSRRS